jgi:hypothetical protein
MNDFLDETTDVAMSFRIVKWSEACGSQSVVVVGFEDTVWSTLSLCSEHSSHLSLYDLRLF